MYFATRMGLRPGDVVVTPKSSANIVEHYVIYIGWDNIGNHWYIENNNKEGVRWIDDASFVADNPKYLRIREFRGTEHERRLAVEKAQTWIGTRYDLTNFNCEHLANAVQSNKSFSKQVNTGMGLAALIGGILVVAGLASSSK